MENAPPDVAPVIWMVVDLLVAELRRRLGGSYTVEEVTALYDRGTDWALDLAVNAAPEVPAAWEPAVADAAFARYVRGAVDYAGGRRLA